MFEVETSLRTVLRTTNSIMGRVRMLDCATARRNTLDNPKPQWMEYTYSGLKGCTCCMGPIAYIDLHKDPLEVVSGPDLLNICI